FSTRGSQVARYIVAGWRAEVGRPAGRPDTRPDTRGHCFVRIDKTSGTQRGAPGRPRKLTARLSGSDRPFPRVATVGGVLVLILYGLVGTFLAYRAWQALHKAGWSFLTTQQWNPNGGGFGIAAVMIGTLLIAGVAVVVGVPLALGTALYISEYAPRSVQRGLLSLIDLMAAVPSVVFGLWGFFLLQWRVVSLSRWISNWFYWIPLFKVNGVARDDPLATVTAWTSSTFAAGLVVALMITPIASSIMREAFSQAPAGEPDGAYALRPATSCSRSAGAASSAAPCSVWAAPWGRRSRW